VWVGDLETVVDAVGLERFALLGVSQAAAIAVACAARHPDRVSRVVLYGGYARGRRFSGQNRVVPVQEGRLLATLIPGAHFILLDSANHILLEQEPAWDVFLSEIEAFLGTDARSGLPIGAAGLTARELEVLRLVSEGLTNQSIAACPGCVQTATGGMKAACRRGCRRSRMILAFLSSGTLTPGDSR
jgi:alpha/beta hydrolase family protein/regulatory LuxR family protein